MIKTVHYTVFRILFFKTINPTIMVCYKSMHTWTIPFITIAFQMFLQMFGEDCLCDKNGCLDVHKHKNLTQEQAQKSNNFSVRVVCSSQVVLELKF